MEKTKETKKTNKITDSKETKIAKATNNDKSELIAVIRISGMVKVKPDVANTLDRMRLRRKYACILMNSNKTLNGMLEKVRFSVAYGKVNKETLIQLIKQRGKNIEGDKKPLERDAEKIASEILNGKKLSELNLKSFFRLHPPKKGIKSKLQYPKGVLGNNKEDINKLIKKML